LLGLLSGRHGETQSHLSIVYIPFKQIAASCLLAMTLYK
jgi:hypothetical protein